jgi:hypothetical protein
MRLVEAVSGEQFFNTSRLDLTKLLDDPAKLLDYPKTLGHPVSQIQADRDAPLRLRRVLTRKIMTHAQRPQTN